jgi:hypothetical protein
VQDLKDSFRKPEFVASRVSGADGWAEARRRQLIKRYLAGKNIAFTETQSPRIVSGKPDKYRNVSIRINGRGNEGLLRVSLVLQPGKKNHSEGAFYNLQQNCDARLFSVLEAPNENLRRFGRLELLVSENCLDLTERRAVEN